MGNIFENDLGSFQSEVKIVGGEHLVKLSNLFYCQTKLERNSV